MPLLNPYFVGTEDPTRFLPLLIVLTLAFTVPLLLASLRRIPVVVGEIVLGVIVGPSLLGWVVDGPILAFMSDIGLAFLMFLAGMEINLDLLLSSSRPKEKQGPSTIATVLSIYGSTLVLAIGGAYYLRRLGIQGDLWLLAFILSATSLGVVLPILKEQDLLRTRFGQTIFLTAMLADFVTVILLTVHLITLDEGFDLEIFSLGLLFLAFLIFYRFGPSIVRIPSVSNLMERLSSTTVQIKVRGAITILMAFVVLAEFVDAELILGAFLAGVIISLLKRPEDEALIENLEAFGFGFFIPVFFIMVGVDLNMQSLLSSSGALLALPSILGVGLAVKLIPMVLAKRQFSWKELLGGGFLLNTHLSLEVAVAVIGLRAGLFNEATSTMVIVYAVLTVLVMPLLYSILAPKAPRRDTPFMLILGASELAIHVSQLLSAHGDQVKIIPLDPEENRRIENLPFINLDMALEELGDLDAHAVRSALVLYEEDERNLEISRLAREAGMRNVIAQVRDPQHLSRFDQHQIKTFSPALQRPIMISMMARNPDALALLTTTGEDRTSVEIQIRNPNLAGRNLRELKLPGDLLVLAIRRKGKLLIPHGSTSFELRDWITALGSHEDLRALRELCEPR